MNLLLEVDRFRPQLVEVVAGTAQGLPTHLGSHIVNLLPHHERVSKDDRNFIIIYLVL